jgi:hypothetical protein
MTAGLVLCALLASAAAAAAQSAPAPTLLEGPSNTAVGQGALPLNSGIANTATGAAALGGNLSGNSNTATGFNALLTNQDGDENVAVGDAALLQNRSGDGNTAVGSLALNRVTGSSNTAVGAHAGVNAVAGSHNVYLGALQEGLQTDAHTMRLGVQYDVFTGVGQARTFIAGIAGTVLTTAALPVFVDQDGQLGTVAPPPFTGTIDTPIMSVPGVDAARLAALEAMVRQQQTTLADLQAAHAADRARLAALEQAVLARHAARRR